MKVYLGIDSQDAFKVPFLSLFMDSIPFLQI